MPIKRYEYEAQGKNSVVDRSVTGVRALESNSNRLSQHNNESEKGLHKNRFLAIVPSVDTSTASCQRSALVVTLLINAGEQ